MRQEILVSGEEDKKVCHVRVMRAWCVHKTEIRGVVVPSGSGECFMTLVNPGLSTWDIHIPRPHSSLRM
jgi:hypothetical protein